MRYSPQDPVSDEPPITWTDQLLVPAGINIIAADDFELTQILAKSVQLFKEKLPP